MAVLGPRAQYLSGFVGCGNGRRGYSSVCRHAIRALPLLFACLLPGLSQSEPAPPSPALSGGPRLMPFTLAQNSTGSSQRSRVLEVQYDPVSDQLSIRADRTPLREVLREISERARVSIRVPDEKLLSEELPIEMKNVPVEQALRQLFRGFDSVFLYSAAVDPQRGTTPRRLDKVILFSRKAGGQIVERQFGTDPRPAVGPGAAPLAAARVQALREPGAEREREKALEALLETVRDRNSPSHYDAIAALHQLAPEKAVGALANLLQGDDGEMRVIAATGFGQIGDERAIYPLTTALTGNDPLARQVAANSLARIGGQRATDVLFQAYLGGDQRLKEAVAGAVAFHADEKSQEALAVVIARGPVPAATTAQAVIASTLPRQEGHDSDSRD
jgi:hypothetical protein